MPNLRLPISSVHRTFSLQAYQNVLAKNGSGETYTFEFKARNILGRKPAETSAAMVEHYKLPITPEEFLEALENEFEVLFPHTTWMPGVLKLLHHLYKVRVKMSKVKIRLWMNFPLTQHEAAHSHKFTL